MDYIYHCANLLASLRKTICCAESATAGRFCSSLSLMPQSGQILIGGIVCYDANVKSNLLGIPKELIERFTPESAEVTKALVEALPKFFSSDVQVAITGLVAPGGSETEDKPVGTIFINATVDGKYFPVRQVFSGSPEQIMLQAVNRAAQCVVEALEEM